MKDFGFDHPPKTQEEALVQGFCLFFTAPSKAQAQKVLGLITLILADPAMTQDMVQTSDEPRIKHSCSRFGATKLCGREALPTPS